MHPLIHNVVKPLLVAAAAVLVGHCGALGLGCAKPGTAPGPTEGAYLTDQIACIQIYGTREEAQACLDDVDRRFGIGIPDAGYAQEGGQ